jgi:hypothetical protein
MQRIIFSIVLAASLAVSPMAMARGHGGSHSSSSSHSHSGGSHSSGSHSGGSYKGGSHSSGSHSSHAPRAYTYHPKSSTPRTQHSTAHNSHHNNTYAQGVQRDSHGKIARSPKAKSDFKKSHPCPSTGKSSGACPGYVIDHVKPLKRGGADKPNNMQWQTKEAAKQKDKWE